MNKIDLSLYKFITAEKKQNSLECFVFVSNIELAKKILKAKYEVEILSEFPFINILRVSGKPNTIFSLSKLDCVKFITSQTKVNALVNVSKKVLKFDGCELTGKGVGIAYIDTGIYPHLDFKLKENRIEFFLDLVDGKTQPYDDNGHGTFVSGVGSGSGLISNQKYSGFAPKSKIVSIKALDQKGEASATRILEAMQWIYSNHKEFGIKIVCMSFGSEPLGYNDPIMNGAEMLWKSGITIVAAAGNSGPEFETIKSPGTSSKIITVGGINDNRMDEANFDKNFFEIAPFSSRGPALRKYKPDLVAPSVEISSCKNSKEFYSKLSGTSVSTPMLAGICACIYEKLPNIRPDVLKKLLISNCTPITFNRNYEGYGLLNVENLLKKI